MTRRNNSTKLSWAAPLTVYASHRTQVSDLPLRCTGLQIIIAFCFVCFFFWFAHTQAHKHDRKFSAPSSETQGQIVGGGKVGIGKKNVGEEKSRAKREVRVWKGKGSFNLFSLFRIFSIRLRSGNVYLKVDPVYLSFVG